MLPGEREGLTCVALPIAGNPSVTGAGGGPVNSNRPIDDWRAALESSRVP